MTLTSSLLSLNSARRQKDWMRENRRQLIMQVCWSSRCRHYASLVTEKNIQIDGWQNQVQHKIDSTDLPKVNNVVAITSPQHYSIPPFNLMSGRVEFNKKEITFFPWNQISNFDPPIRTKCITRLEWEVKSRRTLLLREMTNLAHQQWELHGSFVTSCSC